MSNLLQKLFLPPTFDSEELNRTARILNVILVTLFVAAITVPLLIVLLIATSDSGSNLFQSELTVLLGLGIAGAILVMRRFMYQGRLRLVSWLFTIVLWLGITLTVFQFNGLRDNTVLAFTLIIAIPTILLRERKAVVFFTLLTLLSITAVYIAEVIGVIQYQPIPAGVNDLIIFSVIFIILGVMLAYTLQNLNQALVRAEASEAEAAVANRQLQSLNADLENRVAARTQALVTSAEIGRTVSTILDRELLVTTVAEEIRRAFDYYQVHLYLLDAARDTLELAAGAGYAGEELVLRRHKVSVEKGLVGLTARTNQPVLAPDVTQVDFWLPNPLLPDTRSEVTVPVALGGRVLGVLDIQQNVLNGLGQNDVDLLLSISGQVAVALENSRLLAEARAQAEQEILINQISQQIQSATTIQQAMQIAVREIGRAVKAPQTRIRLSDTEPVQSGGEQSLESLVPAEENEAE